MAISLLYIVKSINPALGQHSIVVYTLRQNLLSLRFNERENACLVSLLKNEFPRCLIAFRICLLVQLEYVELRRLFAA